jgi:hypothetical protein
MFINHNTNFLYDQVTCLFDSLMLLFKDPLLNLLSPFIGPTISSNFSTHELVIFSSESPESSTCNGVDL